MDDEISQLNEEEEIAAVENETIPLANITPLEITISETDWSSSVEGVKIHSPEEIKPLPKKVEVINEKRKRRTQKSEILTSTPVKNRIQQSARKKQQSASKKENVAQSKGKKCKKLVTDAERKSEIDQPGPSSVPLQNLDVNEPPKKLRKRKTNGKKPKCIEESDELVPFTFKFPSLLPLNFPNDQKSQNGTRMKQRNILA